MFSELGEGVTKQTQDLLDKIVSKLKEDIRAGRTNQDNINTSKNQSMKRPQTNQDIKIPTHAWAAERISAGGRQG